MDTVERFVKAQEEGYGQTLMEIKNCQKRSHWIGMFFLSLKGWAGAKRPSMMEVP